MSDRLNSGNFTVTQGVLALLVPAAGLMLAACLIQPTPAPRPTPTPVSSPTPRPTESPTPLPVTPPAARVVVGSDGRNYKQYAQAPAMIIDPSASYTAAIDTSKGGITLELFASEAPITVNNFVFLAREGFYDSVTFHRVIKGFMVQSGDPKGDGTGGPGYRFTDERVSRRYTRGIVAMANAGPNTNGSQFFILHADYGLPPQYTIFGRVIAGLDTIDRLADTPVKAGRPGGEVSVPTETLRIKSIKITETKKR